jgi:hypothetical protein
MTGNPLEAGKGIKPVTKSTTRDSGRGAESVAPLPFYSVN